MPSIDVSREEGEAIAVALRSYLDDLQTEISHTDDYDFRHALQRRRELLEAFLQRLGSSAS